MLHWKHKLPYVAITTLTLVSAIAGWFDGWAW